MEHRRTLFIAMICDAPQRASSPHSCRLISPVLDWLRQCVRSRRDPDWVHHPWSTIQGSVSVVQMSSVLNGTGGKYRRGYYENPKRSPRVTGCPIQGLDRFWIKRRDKPRFRLRGLHTELV